MTQIEFTSPAPELTDARHHSEAATANVVAAAEATQALMAVLHGTESYEKILLRAAAGAGKSYALVNMVGQALANPNCLRVAVTAFANKQVIPLARRLGAVLRRRAGLPLRLGEVAPASCPDGIEDDVTVVTKSKRHPGGRACRARACRTSSGCSASTTGC